MEYLVQLQNLLKIEPRRLLFVLGVVAITHLLCQSLMLPYGKALMSLMPQSEIAILDKNSISVRHMTAKSDSVDDFLLSDEPEFASTRMGKDADNSIVEREKTQRDIVKENGKQMENGYASKDGRVVGDKGEGNDILSFNVKGEEKSKFEIAKNQEISVMNSAADGREGLYIEQTVNPTHELSRDDDQVTDTIQTPNELENDPDDFIEPIENDILTEIDLASEDGSSGNASRVVDNEDDVNGNLSSNAVKEREKFELETMRNKEVSVKKAATDMRDDLSMGQKPNHGLSTDDSQVTDIIQAPEQLEIRNNVSATELLVSPQEPSLSNFTFSRNSMPNASNGKTANKGLPKDEKFVPQESNFTSQSNNSVMVTGTVKKQMRCNMPPKTVMTIDEMNALLIRHRASSRSLRPKWSSVRDQEVLAAREQILNAPIVKSDKELYAPLFRNISIFKRLLIGICRSYELMEQTLRVYVYRDGEKPIFHQPIMKGLYASEGWFMKLMEGNKKFVVKDPRKAHLFYMPFSSRMLEHTLYVRFKIGRDVSLPETYVRSARNPLRDLGGKPPHQRHILAFYAGNNHGYLRPILLKHWKDKDPDMKIFGPMPAGVASKMNYIQHMKSSKFCLCPKGYEVNSPRVVEAIFYECVPVIISDNFVPPFFEVLDWHAFSIILAEKDIPNLKDILLSIPKEKYLEMQFRSLHLHDLYSKI
ncbi:Exostosin, GT47 domain [Dillenia turbinata]|uniref:Exostosin, GT47 domain n=1 Tax=Dillenia turbinata TaxID=194707 RepID=A0AAN8W415_9MAGN